MTNVNYFLILSIFLNLSSIAQPVLLGEISSILPQHYVKGFVRNNSDSLHCNVITIPVRKKFLLLPRRNGMWGNLEKILKQQKLKLNT